MSKLKFLLIASGFVAAIMNAVSAAPVTLEFDDLPDQPVIGGVMSYGPQVIEDGFVLTTNAAFGGFATWPSNSGSYTGSKALFGNQVGSITTLTQQNDDPFSIASMAITFTNGFINQAAEFDLTFNGVKAGGASVQQTFTIGPGFNPSLQTILFSNAFTGLLALNWTHPSQTFQFDNVVVDGAAVAVPAPMAGLLLGLGLVGLFTRRRVV